MSATKQIDFELLKREIGFEQVLTHYGLDKGMKRSGEELRGKCPLHKGKNDTSFSVNTVMNLFRCWSCNASGSIIDFVVRMESCSLTQAGINLARWFTVETEEQTERARPPSLTGRALPLAQASPGEEDVVEVFHPMVEYVEQEPEEGGITTNQPLSFTLDLNPTHKYLRTRGLAGKTINTFGLGHYKSKSGKGIMDGRICVPIHNTEGELVAYAGRWPADSGWPEGEGKYKFPPKFGKSQELFNLHRAVKWIRSDPHAPLVIVEGFFDCMRIWQINVYPVVALMGSSISDQQVELIRQAIAPKGRVVLMLDGDEAGRKGQRDVAEKLLHHLFVRYVWLTDGVQPDQFDDLDSLLRNV